MDIYEGISGLGLRREQGAPLLVADLGHGELRLAEGFPAGGGEVLPELGEQPDLAELLVDGSEQDRQTWVTHTISFW